MGPWSTGENKPRTRLNHGPKAKWVSGISSEYISQSECHMGWKVRRQAWPQGPGGPEWLMWGGQGRACPLREALESNLRKWKEGIIVRFVLLVWLTSCWDEWKWSLKVWGLCCHWRQTKWGLLHLEIEGQAGNLFQGSQTIQVGKRKVRAWTNFSPRGQGSNETFQKRQSFDLGSVGEKAGLCNLNRAAQGTRLHLPPLLTPVCLRDAHWPRRGSWLCLG